MESGHGLAWVGLPKKASLKKRTLSSNLKGQWCLQSEEMMEDPRPNGSNSRASFLPELWT
jgi:hypothetical protein